MRGQIILRFAQIPSPLQIMRFEYANKERRNVLFEDVQISILVDSQRRDARRPQQSAGWWVTFRVRRLPGIEALQCFFGDNSHSPAVLLTSRRLQFSPWEFVPIGHYLW